ncbi:transmembrane protein 231 [Lamellibrachia satsuma]|nr:transmembrane protein 231 [Lamellibrachia satsuma]
MALYEIYTHSELRRYKTHICSKATLVQIFCLLLTFIPPFFVAYRSEGFWKKVEFYREQPVVHFKHQVIVFIQLKDNYVTWSTLKNFNQVQMAHLRIPVVKSREDDVNRDGVLDRLNFQLDMPMTDTEEVLGVTLILLFDYRLRKFATLEMDSMAHVQYSTAIPGASLLFVGDLEFHQSEPLAHKGVDRRFNDEIISSSSIRASDFYLHGIFEKYAKRNMSTSLARTYTTWLMGRAARKPFTIKATINYPEETLLYSPGFWQLIKFAWIQYFAVLVIFTFFVGKMRKFIFQNQLVTTIVQRPWKKMP